jgi:hypothetical protein
MPSSNSRRARGSSLEAVSSGKYRLGEPGHALVDIDLGACSTSGCLSTSRKVPQSPPPMMQTRRGAGWVNSAGWDIISW